MSPSYSSLSLVILGPPGSGKGTQARWLAEAYRIPHISSGDMLRQEVGRGTALGEQVRESIRRGGLVPDHAVAGLVLERLDRDECARGFLLDGYPRTQEQAALLDGILAELGRSIERVVLIDVPDEVAEVRLIDGGDDVEVARERILQYRKHAGPVIEMYRHRGLLLEIDGSSSKDEVAEAVMHAVGAPVGA